MSKALEQLSAQPVIFAVKQSVDKVAAAYGVEPLEVVNFDSQTKIADWVNGRASEWISRLPNIDAYDAVVSDNLIDILRIRDDAWLSGSFFWHESLVSCAPKIKQESRDLLLKHRPKMITSALFSSPYLEEETKQHKVGLFAIPNQLYKGQKGKNSVLISCGRGSGSSIFQAALRFVESICTYSSVPFDSVWVDPILLPNEGVPAWVKEADYTPDMYNSISVAIVRPGIGTVTDALTAGAKLAMF